MPPGCRCHLAMPRKAFLHDPDFIRIAPVPPARSVSGGKDFNLGSELMVGHKVGLITSTVISSDGLRRKHTLRERIGEVGGTKNCEDQRAYFR